MDAIHPRPCQQAGFRRPTSQQPPQQPGPPAPRGCFPTALPSWTPHAPGCGSPFKQLGSQCPDVLCNDTSPATARSPWGLSYLPRGCWSALGQVPPRTSQPPSGCNHSFPSEVCSVAPGRAPFTPREFVHPWGLCLSPQHSLGFPSPMYDDAPIIMSNFYVKISLIPHTCSQLVVVRANTGNSTRIEDQCSQVKIQ